MLILSNSVCKNDLKKNKFFSNSLNLFHVLTYFLALFFFLIHPIWKFDEFLDWSIWFLYLLILGWGGISLQTDPWNLLMSVCLDKLAHVQVVINCWYSVAQLCTHEDTLAHIFGAPYKNYYRPLCKYFDNSVITII